MKKEIKVKKLLSAGPYSQAISAGNLIFVSGQIGIDPKTNSLVEGIERQTKQAIINIEAVLSAAGSQLSDVVKTNIYLSDMDDFPLVNDIYASYFSKPYPARATIQVVRLPKEAAVEIECIAFIK